MDATTADPAFDVRGLRKSYGERTVLDGIDLKIEAGSVFALLGPNGAGKTTTVRILATLISADGGTAVIGGHSLAEHPSRIRRTIGVTGQFSAVDDLLTGTENLRLMTRLRHVPRHGRQPLIDRLLQRFNLTDSADRPASTYSGGMRRRLDLAMTLVGDPRIVFLDEPTTGLDPRGRRAMWEMVRTLVADGVTVLLTTQYLDEADQLADRVAVLDGGRIVAEGTPAELKGTVGEEQLRLRFTDETQVAVARDALARPAAACAGASQFRAVSDDGLELRVPTPADGASVRGVLNALAAAGVEPVEVSTATPDLDDVFLALTGATVEEEQ